MATSTVYSGGGNGITGSRSTTTLYTLAALPGNASINNLVGGNLGKWGSGLGAGAALTYSFNLGDGQSVYKSGYGSGQPDTATGFSVTQQAAAQAAMQLWSSVANITFSALTDSPTQAGDIRWANSDTVSTASAYYPSPSALGGDVWVGTTYGASYANPAPGSYGYATYVHELGHALGLNHPHSSDPTTPAVAGEDQLKYSVMSYRSYDGAPLTGYTTSFYPVSAMLNDIQAMQWLYGANMNYNAGDTVYSWASNQKVYETIWDGGGNDTLSAATQAQACTLNLNSGQWSQIGVAFYNGQATVRDCLTIAYGAVIENAIGSAYADTLIGNSADNRLDGGNGIDTLIGGNGNDTYVYDFRDMIIEGAGGGIDTIEVDGSLNLAGFDQIENLTVTGSTAATLTGNALANVLTGNAANNTLNGSTGKDTMLGGAGDDYYYVDNSGDVVVERPGEGADFVYSSVSYTLSADVERLYLTGTTATNATGNAGDNKLIGNALNNILDGGAGNDVLYGGAGNDTLLVDSASDVIVELLDEGVDTAQSTAVTYTLPNYVENLTLTGTGANAGYGNTLDNVVRGNNADNILGGNAGNDSLIGYGGNDSLNGGAGNDSLNGVDGNDTLVGGDGNDQLLGGTGDDAMTGGAGDDLYYVDSAADTVSELSGGGADFVYATVNYTLSANIERLYLQGTATTGTGNANDNKLIGNTLDNTLDGGAGNDVLYGGAGNDSYWIDSALDVISELVGEGTDTAYATAAFVLSANVENLVQTGIAGLRGDGNALDNSLQGNDGNSTLIGYGGNDTLNGGAGNDSLNGSEGNDSLIGGDGNDQLQGGLGDDQMQGGAGDDVYYVDSAADVVTELAGAGTDFVYSSLNYTLGDNLERLYLTGTALTGTGNAADNKLIGNALNNTLDGGGGNDVLYGGLGNDTYLFGTGSGVDTVSDTDATAGNADLLLLGAGIAVDQIWFRHVGSNLELSIIGTTDKLSIASWYTSADNHVEQIRATDSGRTLADAQVQALVDLMATLTPPPLGQTSLTTAQHTLLDSTITASWV